jgi:hypothetical protein
MARGEQRTDRAGYAPLASLDHLTKRIFSRVAVPARVVVYAELKLTGMIARLRGLVVDISLGGMSVRLSDQLIEPLRAGAPVSCLVEYAGVSAAAEGVVARSSTGECGIRFSGVDGGPDAMLLELMVRIVTRTVDHADCAGLSAVLSAPLTYEHFFSGGYLDIRIQRVPFGWWQLVFLEYLISWREGRGLESGVIEHGLQGARGVVVRRHAEPLPVIAKLARRIAVRCRERLPAHREAFLFVEASLPEV